MQEECIAERIAITKLKTQAATTATAKSEADQKVFEENEFAVSHLAQRLQVP